MQPKQKQVFPCFLYTVAADPLRKKSPAQNASAPGDRLTTGVILLFLFWDRNSNW